MAVWTPAEIPWTLIAAPLSLSVCDFNLKRLAENRTMLFRLEFHRKLDIALIYMTFRL